MIAKIVKMNAMKRHTFSRPGIDEKNVYKRLRMLFS